MVSYKYGTEYELNFSFWERKPAKFINLFVKNDYCRIKNKRILDIGAGEGKNAVYLASLGGYVLATDVSLNALSHFCEQPNYAKSKSRLITQIIDIKHLQFSNNAFDIIIAYGVLHCLDSKKDIYTAIRKIKNWIPASGFFIGCTFNDELPVPECQPYLNSASFLSKGELKELFSDWEVLAYEDDIITEIHPTTNIEHQHALSRIIAGKTK